MKRRVPRRVPVCQGGVYPSGIRTGKRHQRVKVSGPVSPAPIKPSSAVALCRQGHRIILPANDRKALCLVLFLGQNVRTFQCVQELRGILECFKVFYHYYCIRVLFFFFLFLFCLLYIYIIIIIFIYFCQMGDFARQSVVSQSGNP